MCAMLGSRVALIGRVGNDSMGRDYTAHLRSLGVDVAHLAHVDGATTGVASIFVNSSSGENQIIIVPGANEALTPEAVRKAEGVLKK